MPFITKSFIPRLASGQITTLRLLAPSSQLTQETRKTIWRHASSHGLSTRPLVFILPILFGLGNECCNKGFYSGWLVYQLFVCNAMQCLQANVINCCSERKAKKHCFTLSFPIFYCPQLIGTGEEGRPDDGVCVPRITESQLCGRDNAALCHI